MKLRRAGVKPLAYKLPIVAPVRAQLKRLEFMDCHFDNIIGKSKALRDVLEMVKKVANTQATVLITGDSGTGKELTALALHARP